MKELNMNEMKQVSGGNTTPFGIGMPTPMDDTRQKIDEQVKKGPCPFDAVGGPAGVFADAWWVLYQLGWV